MSVRHSSFGLQKFDDEELATFRGLVKAVAASQTFQQFISARVKVVARPDKSTGGLE